MSESACCGSNPKAWVGQERVARSSAPVWEEQKIRPGHVSMRTFLTVSNGSSLALPGGMVRISDTPYESLRNPFEGGGTKDAWVLADKPVEPTSLLRKPGDPLQLVRSDGFLPSRIANNLCWLGRYLERADASARLLRAVATRLTGEADPDDCLELPALIRVLALSGQIDSGYAIHEFSESLPSLESSLALNALTPEASDSLRFQVDQIVSLAGTVRDRLSIDAWRMVQEMNSSFNSSDPRNCDIVDLLDTIETLVVGLAAFSGFVSECMTRTGGFSFLNIGRRLERRSANHKVSAILFCQTTGSPCRAFGGGTGSLRKRLNLSRPAIMRICNWPASLDLLLVDEKNPRSLAYQLHKLNANLESLHGKTEGQLSRDRELASETLRLVRATDMLQAAELNEHGERSKLSQLLEMMIEKLPKISTAISNKFFVHSGPVHQMVVDPESNPAKDLRLDSSR